jgi:hypothetical protein
LKERKDLLELFDAVFTSNFGKLQTSNMINIAKIFAKSSYVPLLDSKTGQPKYFRMLEDYFL